MYYPGPSMRQWAGGENGALYYYTTDLPGSVTGLYRANGSSTGLTNEYRYTPWGAPEAGYPKEGTPNPLRSMAREIDGSTGLYYVRNRWYDPALGRFISEDPIGLAGGINWYTYAGNSPTNFLDPFGLEPCVITYSYKYYKDTGEIVPGSIRILKIQGDCGGGGGGGGGNGNAGEKKEPTECQKLAAYAGAVANGSKSVDQFVRRFGWQVARVNNTLHLVSRGTDVISAATGGYKSTYGGNELGQARHFAGSLWGAQHIPRGAITGLSSITENPRFPGGHAEDHNLSLEAFRTLDALKSGAVKLDKIDDHLLKNLCQ